MWCVMDGSGVAGCVTCVVVCCGVWRAEFVLWVFSNVWRVM